MSDGGIEDLLSERMYRHGFTNQEVADWIEAKANEAVGLEAEVDRANGVISMLEHHWISPMEYYEATKRDKMEMDILWGVLKQNESLEKQALVLVVVLAGESDE